MKKTMILLIAILLSITVNAQWHQSYGVTNVNDLTLEQCNFSLQKAEKTIKAGKAMTFGGAAVSLIGIVVYSNAVEKEVNDIWDGDYNVETGGITTGAILTYGGAAICGIGIPVWVSGSSQKTQIEIALKKFNTSYHNQTFSPGIGINISF